jgi:hypothetical protein
LLWRLVLQELLGLCSGGQGDPARCSRLPPVGRLDLGCFYIYSEVCMSIKVGDKVRTGVYVMGEWKPMASGFVVAQSCDGSVSDVDIGSLHGAAPWIHKEVTSHLRLMPMLRADGGEDISL